MADGNEKSIVGMSVLALVVLLHFIYFAFTSEVSIVAGFMAGVMGAIGIAVLSIVVTVAYRLFTKAKDGLFAGFLGIFGILVLANLARVIVMPFITQVLPFLA